MQTILAGLRRSVSVATAAYAAFTLAVLVSGDWLLVVRFGLYVLPLVTLAGGGLAVLALVLRRRQAAAMMALICGMLAWLLYGPTVHNLANQVPAANPGSQTLSVVSVSNRGLNHDMGATADFVLSLKADLVLLQEIADTDALLALMADRTGQRVQACAHADFAIISHHRVESPSYRDPKLMACPVHLPGGRVLAISVHLPKPILTRTIQDAALERLVTAMAATDLPLIVAGDFNATPLTGPIRRMGALLEDAHQNAGHGLGLTFPTAARRLGTFGPFMRIDHIFHSPAFRTVEAGVMDHHTPLADHFPVRAVLHRHGGAQP